MLQAKRASRACRVEFVGFLGRQLLSTGPKGLLSSMRVCTSALIMGVCPVARVHQLGQRPRPDACRMVTPRTHGHRRPCMRGMPCADFGAADDWTRARSGGLVAHD